MAHPFKLIATDLDGTLLRSDLTVSPRTRSALAAAESLGVVTAFVTARPPRAIRGLAADLGLHGMAICSNGAILYDIAGDRIVERQDLALDAAAGFAASIRAGEPHAVFGVEYGTYVRCEPGFPGDGAFREVAEDCIVPTQALWAEAIVKLVVHHPHDPLEDFIARIARHVGAAASVTHSGGAFAEIAAAEVSKADGVARLCARMGIGLEAVLAFGDMPNDIPMLTKAGHGVAVANAHATVREAADEVTASNEDDGVALVIERALGL